MSERDGRGLNHDDSPAGGGGLQLPDELKRLEAQLSTLVPLRDRLERERLAFLAGQASVAESTELPRTLLGMRLNHEAWPAAFAGMTAVAASLLGLLITQMASVEQPSFAPIRIAGSDTAPRTEENREVRNVLSTSDVYRLDIDDLLARGDAVSAGRSGRLDTVPGDLPTRPELTPTSWEQVLEGFRSGGPSSNDSSNLHPIRGVQS
jgi:hypothetical protein